MHYPRIGVDSYSITKNDIGCELPRRCAPVHPSFKRDVLFGSLMYITDLVQAIGPSLPPDAWFTLSILLHVYLAVVNYSILSRDPGRRNNRTIIAQPLSWKMRFASSENPMTRSLAASYCGTSGSRGKMINIVVISSENNNQLLRKS